MCRLIGAPIAAVPDVRDPCAHHRPLALAQVPTVKIETEDKGKDAVVVAVVGPERRLYTGLLTGEVAIAAVEDAPVMVQPDRLTQAVGLDVGRKLGKLGIAHQRENVGDGMECAVHVVISPQPLQLRVACCGMV